MLGSAHKVRLTALFITQYNFNIEVSPGRFEFQTESMKLGEDVYNIGELRQHMFNFH